MAAVHVFIRGRVQGVGFRLWLQREAEREGLAGWVRNLRDGSVEAILAGEQQAIDRVIGACRAGGPPGGIVTELVVEPAEAPATPGFFILPTE